MSIAQLLSGNANIIAKYQQERYLARISPKVVRELSNRLSASETLSQFICWLAGIDKCDKHWYSGANF
jgi:hypothetical protein